MDTENTEVFNIGTAADILKISPRTLRTYEKKGLVRPMRKGNWRYYSLDNIKWIECLHDMIHENGINIVALHKLLQRTTCWNISGCPFDKRKQCTAFMSNALVPRKINRSPAPSPHRHIVPMPA